jgi:hypothetical protein
MKKPKRKRVGPLKSPTDVAKYMARCIRITEKGEGDVNTSYKLVMMASMMLRAFEAGDLEERISRLEEKLH